MKLMSFPLDERRSIPARLLGTPGPSADQLQQILRSASRVPDHGGLVPWRFLHIHGTSRAHLGEALARRLQARDPSVDEMALNKERQRFSYAPDVIVVIGCFQTPHRIPLIEQQLSAGCVCFAMLQAAQALGFGAQWLTGWAAYDPVIGEYLGIDSSQAIVGFIHIGTPKNTLTERVRPNVNTLLTEWQG